MCRCTRVVHVWRENLCLKLDQSCQQTVTVPTVLIARGTAAVWQHVTPASDTRQVHDVVFHGTIEDVVPVPA